MVSPPTMDVTDATRPETTRSTVQRRRHHPQDPSVQGPDVAVESKTANIQRIACCIVALNAYSLRAFQDGWFLSPQVLNRGPSEEFEKFMSEEEKSHVDFLSQLSDHRFDQHIADYVESLSPAERLSRIADPGPSSYYSDLPIVLLKRYRAGIAHAALASKFDKFEIPDQYDYCETYQSYVEHTAVQEIATRHELSSAIKRSSALLDSIRIAVEDGSLSDTCLAVLKNKVAALQEHFPEAHAALFDSRRDLFDPNAKNWWEIKPAAEASTLQATLDSSPPVDAASAYPSAISSLRPTFEFTVPTVCLLCCIPIGYACFYSSSQPGTTKDSDFWELVAGSILQCLSLATLLWPAVVQSRLHPQSSIYIWILSITSVVTVPISILFYSLVSARWSIVTDFAGNVAQVLILLQLMNTL